MVVHCYQFTLTQSDHVFKHLFQFKTQCTHQLSLLASSTQINSICYTLEIAHLSLFFRVSHVRHYKTSVQLS